MVKPIGYWLKHLDRLIEASFDRVLAQEGLSRRHWQVLNMLREAPRPATELERELAPFWEAGTVRLEEVLDDLAGRGWLAGGAEGPCSLSPAGLAAQASVAERVQANRRLVMEGLTEQEYTSTVDVLSRMAANLEAAS